MGGQDELSDQAAQLRGGEALGRRGAHAAATAGLVFVRFAEGVTAPVGRELGEVGRGGHDQAHVAVPAVPGAGPRSGRARGRPWPSGRPARCSSAARQQQRARPARCRRGAWTKWWGHRVRIVPAAADQQPALEACCGDPAQRQPRPMAEPRAPSRPRRRPASASSRPGIAGRHGGGGRSGWGPGPRGRARPGSYARRGRRAGPRSSSMRRSPKSEPWSESARTPPHGRAGVEDARDHLARRGPAWWRRPSRAGRTPWPAGPRPRPSSSAQCRGR